MTNLTTAFTVAIASLILAASASAGPRLYAPDYSDDLVYAYEAAGDGALAPLPGSPFALLAGPDPKPVSNVSGLAFAPHGDRAASGYLFKGGVAAADATVDGTLVAAGTPVTTPSVTNIAVSPDGRFVYAGTRDFMGVSAVGVLGYELGAGGSLSPLPGSPYGGAEEIRDVAITPDGRFLYASIFGNVRRFAINPDGSLAMLGDTPATGADYLTTSPDSRLLFVGITSGVGHSVRAFVIGPDGDLTAAGTVETGGSALHFFAVSPDGSHLYVPDINTDAVQTVAVGGDGSLTVLGSVAIEEVHAIAVSPDGRFAYLQNTDGIHVASIGADGNLSLTGRSTPMGLGEVARPVFQPQPAPVARFEAKAGAPKSASRFDASASKRAATFTWDFGDGTVVVDGGPKPRHKYKRAGVYEVTLRVADAAGCSAAQVYTGQSTFCPGGADTVAKTTVDTPPLISKLKAKPPKLAFKLSEKAKVKVAIERKAGKRFTAVGKLKVKGKKGKNRKALPARLAPGTYRVSAVATDKAGGKSKRKRAKFKVS